MLAAERVAAKSEQQSVANRRMSRLLEIGPWRGSPKGAPARGRCRWLIEFGACICLHLSRAGLILNIVGSDDRSPLMVWMSMDNDPEALAQWAAHHRAARLVPPMPLAAR